MNSNNLPGSSQSHDDTNETPHGKRSSREHLSRGAALCIREEICFMLFQPHHAAHFQPVSFHELALQRGRICQRKQGVEPAGGFGERVQRK